MALAAGANIDEVVGTLIAVAPWWGWRAWSPPPERSLALSYDLDAAFEAPDADEQ